MNILSFDIEEWFLQKEYFGNKKIEYNQYDRYLNQILNILDERNIKATFFCVGGLAREFPDVIRLIYQRGHEVGCHSDKHVWLNKMTYNELYEDTRLAITSIEQIIGQKVKSYRAPAFTIGDHNKYALEILAECGIENDASIFPAVHAFGGFEKFESTKPCLIKYNGIIIKEFPICTTKILGKNIAYSGGGYFRFFPLWFIKRKMEKESYNMTYFHIFDLIGQPVLDKDIFESYFKIPGTWKNRKIREFKGRLGAKGAFDKMIKLIESNDFINLNLADLQIDWASAPIIEL